MTRAAAVLGMAFALAGCTRDAAPPAPSPRPYVVTAIDYHFHDAHPSLPIVRDRPVVFKNVGRNPHQVTIPELGYARELPVGEELQLESVAALGGGAGRYPFFCSYHRDREMTGVLVIR